MPFTPTGNGMYKSPSGRKFTAKQVKAYYATNGFTKNKKVFHVKHKLHKVDNKLKSLGEYDESTGVIKINKKKNKKTGNKGELINTIVHEEYHKKHPKATEKTTYARTKQIVKKLTPKAKKKLYARYK